MSLRCSIDTQKGFGPSNPWCYGGFDFTLFFEEITLSIIPFTIVFPVLIFRLIRLHKASVIVEGQQWHIFKQVRTKIPIYASFIFINFVLVLLRALLGGPAPVLRGHVHARDSQNESNNCMRGRRPHHDIHACAGVLFRALQKQPAVVNYLHLPYHFYCFQCRPSSNTFCDARRPTTRYHAPDSYSD